MLNELIYAPHGDPLKNTILINKSDFLETVRNLTKQGNRVSWLPLDLPDDVERRSSGRVTLDGAKKGRSRYVIIDVDLHDDPFPVPAPRVWEISQKIVKILEAWGQALAGILHTGGGFQLWLELDRVATGEEISHILAALQQDVESTKNKKRSALKFIDRSSFSLLQHQRAPESENRKNGLTHSVFWLSPISPATMPLPVDALRVRGQAKKAFSEHEQKWRVSNTKSLQKIRKLRAKLKIENVLNIEKKIDRSYYSMISCPIHPPDEDPSLVIYDHEWGQLFLDLHDHKTYDIFGLLKEIWHVNFPDVLRKVASNTDFNLTEIGFERQDQDLLDWFKNEFQEDPSKIRIKITDGKLGTIIFGGSAFLGKPKTIEIPFDVFISPQNLWRFCILRGKVFEEKLDAKDLMRLVDIIVINARENDYWVEEQISDVLLDEILQNEIWSALMSDPPVLDVTQPEILMRSFIFVDGIAPNKIYVNFERLLEIFKKKNVKINHLELAKLLESSNFFKDRVTLKNNRRLRRWAILWDDWKKLSGWQFDSLTEAKADRQEQVDQTAAKVLDFLEAQANDDDVETRPVENVVDDPFNFVDDEDDL